MSSRIHDLDELVLMVRNARARTYFTEAVRSYQAGAIRSCIIATWIAVVFDIVEKMRELDLTGDANARKKVQEFEHIHAIGDVNAALDFEKAVLGMARNEFELIGPQEYEDLSRLHADRNRCAHPSLTIDDVYEPSPELARYHMHGAVFGLFRHPPVQGKAALDRLFKETESEYFPTSVEKVLVVFKSGPLSRPKDALVRNFTLALMKVLLSGDLKSKETLQRQAALAATRQMHPGLVDKAFAETLSRLVRELNDTKLKHAVRFLHDNNAVWAYLEGDVQQKLSDYVEQMKPEDVKVALPDALSTPDLRQSALSRLNMVSNEQLHSLIDVYWWDDAPPELIDLAVRRFATAYSWEAANDAAKVVLLPHIAELNASHFERVIKAVKENPKLVDAFETGKVLAKIKETGIIPEERFRSLLTQYGLEKQYQGLMQQPVDDDVPF